MPLNDEQKDRLFGALQRLGWEWRDAVIYAPNETIFLMKERPWEGDLADFIERMEGRLARIANNRFEGFERALGDTRLLVTALRSLRD